MKTIDYIDDRFIVRTIDYAMVVPGKPPMRLSENVIVAGNAPDDFLKYSATVLHQIRGSDGKGLVGTDGEPIAGRCVIGIDARTIEEAFEMLPARMEKAGNDIQAEYDKRARPSIVIPGPRLIGRNGRL